VQPYQYTMLSQVPDKICSSHNIGSFVIIAQIWMLWAMLMYSICTNIEFFMVKKLL